ncbi:hypothetical protein LINPERHAP2_LOCUS13524 [Linum perenne]
MLPIRLNNIHRLITVGRSFVMALSHKTSRGRVMESLLKIPMELL